MPKLRENMTKKELKVLKEVEEVFKLNLSTIEDMTKVLTNNNFKNIKIEFLEYPKWFSNPLFDSMIESYDDWNKQVGLNDFGKMSGLSELQFQFENFWAVITTKYKNNEKI